MKPIEVLEQAKESLITNNKDLEISIETCRQDFVELSDKLNQNNNYIIEIDQAIATLKSTQMLIQNDNNN